MLVRESGIIFEFVTRQSLTVKIYYLIRKYNSVSQTVPCESIGKIFQKIVNHKIKKFYKKDKKKSLTSNGIIPHFRVYFFPKNMRQRD